MNQSIQAKLDDFFCKKPITKYQRGEIITQAGEDPKGISQLISGTIEQYDITPEGNTVTVNIFKPPAYFPMSWAINKVPNEYFFSALTDVALRFADADETVLFVRDNPDVMFDLLSRLYRGTDALLKRHVILARGIASNRLIFELLIEGYRFGTKVDGSQVRISIKQVDLAARCGLARETVSRELHKLEAAGLLQLTKAGISFDQPALELKLNSIITAL